MARDHRELIFALRHGVIVRRKATVKFNALLIHLTALAADNDRVEYAGFDATDEYDAARKAADWDAKRKYGDEGISTWLSALEGTPKFCTCAFLSFVGVGGHRSGGYVTNGVTVEIRLTRVD